MPRSENSFGVLDLILAIHCSDGAETEVATHSVRKGGVDRSNRDAGSLPRRIPDQLRRQVGYPIPRTRLCAVSLELCDIVRGGMRRKLVTALASIRNAKSMSPVPSCARREAAASWGLNWSPTSRLFMTLGSSSCFGPAYESVEGRPCRVNYLAEKQFCAEYFFDLHDCVASLHFDDTVVVLPGHGRIGL